MVEPIAPPHPLPSTPATTATICPYLLADGGAWRASTATRAHRCAAVTPPAILAADKQRRLCLTTDHGACATFAAARSLRVMPERPNGPRPERPTARAIARTTPLILDHGRLALGPSTGGFRLDRSIGQAALVVLMVLAFAAILVARLTSGEPSAAGVAGSTGTPGPAASVVTSADPGATPEPSAPSPSTAVSPDPGSRPSSETPDASATPTAPATYVVQPGDTLSGIAAEFGTTWQILAELNEIDDPGSLRVGQELRLP